MNNKDIRFHCGIDVLSVTEQEEFERTGKLHNEMLKPKSLTASFKNKYKLDEPKFTEKESDYIENCIKLQIPILNW